MSAVAEFGEDHSRVPVPSGRRKPFPERIKTIVWARAAGRCQYAGCNASLIGDEISGATNANKAYIGHIVADAVDGPRGDPVLSPKFAHDPDNLMLVCDAHHRVFDREMVAEHPVEVLLAMKRRHEARIRTVTAIDEDLGSHVIRYAAKIGTNESPVAVGDLKWSMLPDRYPIDGGWVDLDSLRSIYPITTLSIGGRISGIYAQASPKRSAVGWSGTRYVGWRSSHWRQFRS